MQSEQIMICHLGMTLQSIGGWFRLLVIVGFLLAGCDRTDDLVRSPSARDEAPVLTNANLTARSVIAQCVRRYQGLSSYEDAGVVQLSYRLDGVRKVDRAPLSIAWDRDGHLGLRVYSVEAGPSSGRWRLRLTDGSYSTQLISRAVPKSLDFDWLLDDPIVADRLAAGIAGFPPQLDLLMSPTPLAGLVDDSAMLALETQQSIEGRACYVVAITRGNLTYRLWIDQSGMLLRRVQIPNENLAREILDDQRVTELNLSIELEQVRSDAPVDWERFSIEPRPSELLLSHFVEAPELIDTPGIGKQIPAFMLHAPSGEKLYQSADKGPRKASILIWLADHPACRLAAEQLSNSARALAAKGISQADIEFVCVWAEPKPPEGMTFDSLSERWNLPGKLVVDRDALGRDLFAISEAPTLIVLDSANRVQLRESRSNPVLDHVLPSLLSELANGVDLAAAALERNAAATTRYSAELTMAASVDGQPSRLPENYSTRRCQLIELHRRKHKQSVVAASADGGEMLWQLTSSGLLQCLNAESEISQSLQTDWDIVDRSGAVDQCNASLRLLADSGGRYFAFLDSQSSRVQVFCANSRQSTTIELDGHARPVDAQWLQFSNAQQPRLALISSDFRTVLLDPTNHEQLSGECPSKPMAILGQGATGPGQLGFVSLLDGSIEPLEVSQESTLNSELSALRSQRMAESVTNKLSFTPLAGPWQSWSDSSGSYVLAKGWLAIDEPAMFLLDSSFSPQWHYRLPCSSEDPNLITTAARDPATGQPVWALADTSRVIHILRADGKITDHFRTEQDIVGISLTASGPRLILRVVHTDATASYELGWR